MLRAVLVAKAMVGFYLLSGCSVDAGNEAQRTDARSHGTPEAVPTIDGGDAKGLISTGPVVNDAVVERDFAFTIGKDSACNRNCLSLVVNDTETYELGCNKPKPTCAVPSQGEPARNVKLKVYEKSLNVFKLVMTSADQATIRRPKVVFDSSADGAVADVDFRVEERTATSLDFWLNDNGDADYRDFHGVMTGPADTRFVVKHLSGPPLYPTSADRTIDECRNAGTGSEACLWRYHYGAGCRQNKCSKLLIYFSGGQMSCPDPVKSPLSYLARYAEAGYVAVCARIHETEPSSGLYPFHKEAARVDLLVKTITSDPAIRQGWNGERLLFSGVSHGATAVAVAMARKDFDATDRWRGMKTTAACLFDGIYNARESLVPSSSAQDTSPVGNACSIYPRAFGRYCPWTGDRRFPATWPHPDSCQTADTAQDTIDAVGIDDLAIKNWKVIECGSSLDYCTEDLVAARSQKRLCNRIDADAAKACSFASFPTVGHNDCGATVTTMDSCRSWFDQLP